MSSSNIFALYAYRQRDYLRLGAAIFVDSKQQEVATSVTKLIESFRDRNSAISTTNTQLCIKTKDGFSLHLIYREFGLVGVPLGIIFIAAARELHKGTLVNGFLNDVANALNTSPSDIKMADSCVDPDVLTRVLTSASQLPLKKYDQGAGDMLTNIQNEMNAIRDNVARNVDKLHVNTDNLTTIEQNAGQLASSAEGFKIEAKKVEKAAKCRKIKIYCIIAAVILVVLLIIILPIALR